MRLREVEIHHADLDAGYGRSDWPAAFAERLVDQLAGRAPADASRPPTPAAPGWVPRDRRSCRAPSPTSGWWLSGRGDGDGLTARDGALPTVAAW